MRLSTMKLLTNCTISSITKKHDENDHKTAADKLQGSAGGQIKCIDFYANGLAGSVAGWRNMDKSTTSIALCW